jgi:hypothetical protein
MARDGGDGGAGGPGLRRVHEQEHAQERLPAPGRGRGPAPARAPGHVGQCVRRRARAHRPPGRPRAHLQLVPRAGAAPASPTSRGPTAAARSRVRHGRPRASRWKRSTWTTRRRRAPWVTRSAGTRETAA